MCPTLSSTDTIKYTQYGKVKAHATPEGLWGALYYQGVIDIGVHKSNVIGKMFPELLKLSLRWEILKQCTI